MHRDVLTYLAEWRSRPSRKPLVIRGARQVGKTWLVRRFAKQFENYIEINCETESSTCALLRD